MASTPETSSLLSTAMVNDLLSLIQQTPATSQNGNASTIGKAGNYDVLTQAPASTPLLVRKTDQEMQNRILSLQGLLDGHSSTTSALVRMTTHHHHQQLLQHNTFLQRQHLPLLNELVARQTMTHQKNQVMEQQIHVANILNSQVRAPDDIKGYPLHLHHHHPSSMVTGPFQASSLGLNSVNALLASPATKEEGHTRSTVVEQQGQGEAMFELSSLAIIPEDIPEEGSAVDSFPFKVYRLLAYAEKAGKTHIISFCPNGKTFKIHEPRDFENEIMPLFFNTNRVASFQRQLNQYGFQRVQEGPYRGGFRHEHFIKGHPLSCQNIIRKKRAPPSKVRNKAPIGKGDMPDDNASDK